MKKLQDDYMKSTNISLYVKIEDEQGNRLLDIEFPADSSEKNIFIYMHKLLTKELLDNIDDILKTRTFEMMIETVEDVYLDYYMEIHTDTDYSCLYVKTEDYRDYVSDDELLIMSEKCALYEIECLGSQKTFETLTDEYFHLSADQIIDEYEKYYDVDYHEEYLNSICKNVDDDIIKKMCRKSIDNYRNTKAYVKKNKSYELRRCKHGK